ncbi:Rdx family-domain-containing protein [Thelephora terrestris]|uniref:Rdx family-domain-containing protein n=1 Tax=Thelephora terrestris TaxID=56493 RepID=A0A9P6H6D6_9AGAM|nr:Rdx family-domain-containing protein [Thelephora terrestris]
MTDSEPNCVDCEQQQATPTVPVESPSDPATFVAPATLASPRIVIEFCNRCRWLHRAQWVATELFLTFPPPELASISVVPLASDETAGRFRVWIFADPSPTLVWDRKVEGGFPELKVLKQRIRDRVQPGKSLGHSDAGARQ